MINGDKYNKQRKMLLQGLDDGKPLSIIELGMYDLTPYFTDKFDVSLSEAIMLNQNLERRIQHLKDDLYFSPPQNYVLDTLGQYNRVILSAPTSFGKTLLIKEYIYIYQPKNIVYIVPTNALAYELEKSFKNNPSFDNYIIFDRSNESLEKSEITEKLLFIGTQEKFLEIDSETLKDIDLFVIDEAYKLQETINHQRGYKLSATFLESISRKSRKIFLLTPQAKFKGFDNYEFYLIETTFNAVEKNFVVLKDKEFFDILLDKGKKEKSILFCNSPRQINNTYNSIKDRLTNIGELTNFIALLETDIHPDWTVVKLLKAGILTHHGQMPKYIQNKMINLFNSPNNHNILLGTNSISEGINTVTKNLFIHPEYDDFNNILLLKNTIGRAGRLGEFPIGHIFSTSIIENIVDKEIEIELSLSKEEELSELEDTNDDFKILKFSKFYNLEFEFCKDILKKNKLSLSKLEKMLIILKINLKYRDISNLPFMSQQVFSKEYSTSFKDDAILIKGYLQQYYLENEQKIFLNNFDDRLRYYKKQKYKPPKSKKATKQKRIIENSEIINLYMQFIYSSLEYYIMPLVNIGLEVKSAYPNWVFGENVVETLEVCKKKYYQRTFGNLDVDKLSESHMQIISALRDYGINTIIKSMTIELLDEINTQLKTRYSTIDVLKAIEYLSTHSLNNKAFFAEIKKKYID